MTRSAQALSATPLPPAAPALPKTLAAAQVISLPTREAQNDAAAPPRRARILAWLQRAFSASAAILVVFALWEVAPRVGLTERTFLPPVSEVLASGWRLIASGQLLQHLQASLARSLSGFAIALLYAVPLGLAIGWYRGVARALNPLLEVLRNTAALALLPVFILLLGIGETSKIALIVYACSWPILLNTISGVQQVDPLLIKSARTMGASPLQMFTKVILPASVPTIFVGIRLAGAVSVLVLVAAEMIGAKAGLGYLVIYSQYNFQIPQMYFGILAITAVGLSFNWGLVRLERRFTGWRASPEDGARG